MSRTRTYCPHCGRVVPAGKRCPAEIDGKKPHERLDGCSHNCVSAMRHDIVLRCRALAERGE